MPLGDLHSGGVELSRVSYNEQIFGSMHARAKINPGIDFSHASFGDTSSSDLNVIGMDVGGANVGMSQDNSIGTILA